MTSARPDRPAPFRPRSGTIPTLPIPQADGWRSLHMVGVGGAGMSGLARLLLARGIGVSGSDLKWSRGLEVLETLGATVLVGHRAEQVGDPDAVVVSSAIPPDNVEVRAARDRGIPVLARAQVLAALMRGRRGVAVAGTHGKTTTTSMISVALTRAGLHPTFVIGGDLNESGSGAEHGSGDLFVAEADESDGSFLLLEPDIAVITNVEEDHLDFYAGREEIESAFAAFAARAGVVVAWWEDPGVLRALEGADARVIRHGGSSDLEVVTRDVVLGPGGSTARVDVLGAEIALQLSVPGRHNLRHAAETLAVAHVLGAPLELVADALRSFTGVRRRFELRGRAAGATFRDDYAHHPSEIATMLDVARAEPSRRVVAVVQPHRYTRTQAMWREFGESLVAADVVVVTDVYAAGERPIPGVSGKLLVDALAEAASGKRVIYLPRRSEIAPFLAGFVREGDLVLTLGAGDITTIADETLERIRDSAT